MSMQLYPGQYNMVLGGFPANDPPTGVYFDNNTQTIKAMYGELGMIVKTQLRPGGRWSILIADKKLTNGKDKWLGLSPPANTNWNDLQGVALKAVSYPFAWDAWPSDSDSSKIRFCIENTTMTLATAIKLKSSSRRSESDEKLELDIIFRTHTPGNDSDESFVFIKNSTLVI